MQLKRFTDLGLRVLVFLSDKTDHPTALIDIADALQWNKNQLIKELLKNYLHEQFTPYDLNPRIA